MFDGAGWILVKAMLEMEGKVISENISPSGPGGQNSSNRTFTIKAHQMFTSRNEIRG